MQLAGDITPDGQHIEIYCSTPNTHTTTSLTVGLLRLLTPLLGPTEPPGGVRLPLTWSAVVQLAMTFGAQWVPGPRLVAWTQTQVRQRVPAPSAALALTSLPTGCIPRGYQLEAAGLIASNRRVMVADEPGTGKTVTAILGVLLAHQTNKTNTKPVVIVVCPASMIDSWVMTWRLWAPEWRAIAWRGNVRKRAALLKTADVYIMSYDMARVGANIQRSENYTLGVLNAATIIVDEHHLMKNPYAARSTAVRRLCRHADSVVALSGTPITHNPGDLWPVLAALEPNAWPSRQRWVDRYCLVVQGDYSAEIHGLRPDHEPEFRTVLLGQYRRVAKADVLTHLPPKNYSVRYVHLPRPHRRAYDDMSNQMLAELENGEQLSAMSVLAQLTRLSQMASAPVTVAERRETHDDGTTTVHQSVSLYGPSWKVDALCDILDERPLESVLVFASSRQLTLMAATAATGRGRRVGVIVGGQTAKQRTAVVDSFQAGKLNVVCATTGAGGVGLTLTAASTVVFLQRPWSLVESSQSEERAHRLGSEIHKAIEIIDVVAVDTVDSRVREVLRGKATQLGNLLQDPRIVTHVLGGH